MKTEKTRIIAKKQETLKMIGVLFAFMIAALICTSCTDITGNEGGEPASSPESPLLTADFSSPEPGSFASALLANQHITLAKGKGPGQTDAIKVDYVGYERGSKRVIVRHKLPKPCREATISYYVKFADDFQFVKGGKLPGLGPEKPITGGNNMNPKGWSDRIMFKDGGHLINYLYTQDKTIKWGVGGKAKDFQFIKGKWHAISIHVRVNSASDSKDGFSHVYADGKLVIEDNNQQFRAATGPDTEICKALFCTFHGGHTLDWTPIDAEGNPTTVHALFSQITVHEGKYILAPVEN